MTTELRTLAERLGALEDTEQIRTLKNRYHTYVNDTEFDRISELFTEDAAVRLGYLMPNEETVVGRPNIHAAFSAMRSSGSSDFRWGWRLAGELGSGVKGSRSPRIGGDQAPDRLEDPDGVQRYGAPWRAHD